ncbi:metal ABC transporter substrate-binding protein [Pasteuria penetrans]|uniref:metal ABC transporter substrate-binding protein n=1 Tax=Pasteuria penetrans TaxID=86005 RepID=UPI000F97A43E|nr:zinc ABC transporter substrate-binding protein [Pasteuria penetrans]
MGMAMHSFPFSGIGTRRNFFILLLFLLPWTLGCDRPGSERSLAPAQGLRVVVTSFPLEYFVKGVGGDLVSVENMLGAGGDPHHIEPTLRNRAHLARAQLVVYEGADPSVRRLIDVVRSEQKGTHWLDLALWEDRGDGADEVDAGRTHRWLDPHEAKVMVEQIGSVLSRMDPAHQSSYVRNVRDLQQRLELLRQRYDQVLSQARQKTLAVVHDGFRVLARRYGLRYVSVLEAHHEYQEPSPRRLQDLMATLRAQGVRTLFTQPGVEQGIAHRIGDALGAQILPLHAMESSTQEERQQGYFYWMERNLNQLAKGFGVSYG